MREQKPSARILIADDHQLLADACKSLLEPEFQVVGTVTDGRCLIAAAADSKPDIIILDIYMPHLNGLDAGAQVKHKTPGVKLVFLTMTMAADVAAVGVPPGRFWLRTEAIRWGRTLACGSQGQPGSILSSSPLIVKVNGHLPSESGRDFQRGETHYQEASEISSYSRRVCR